MDSDSTKPEAEEAEDGPDHGSDRGFAVRDRRWWVGNEGADEADPAAEKSETEPEKPSFVAALERQVEEQRRIADEARARQRAAIEEFERARQRIERDAAREQEARHRSVLASFLPVLDDLDRALAAAHGSEDVAAVVDGVALVRKTFLAKLQEHGVVPLEASGAAFDPAIHEAVATLPVQDPDLDGRVVAVHREGYSLGDGVLRPPLVVVGKA